jgi:transcriptional regulator with XRE-family HTH domain
LAQLRVMESTMSTVIAKSSTKPGPGRSRAQDVDRYVGARMRERRIMLGLTQQQMAELIGVTYQQAHKYEKGINRIASGRLYNIAQALGVDIGYFFEGLTATSLSRRGRSNGCRWSWRAVSFPFHVASTKKLCAR